MSDDKSKDDDDLMSDFKDLFPDEEDAATEVGESENGTDGGEALDELDALLDDFESSFDSSRGEGDEDEAGAAVQGDEAPLLTEEVEAEQPDKAAEEPFELNEDDLDLAMSDAADSEVFDDGWGQGSDSTGDEQAEPEPEPETIQSEMDDKATEQGHEAPSEAADPLSEVAALAATGSSVEMARPEPATTEAPPLDKRLLWSLTAVMVVALVVASASLWMAFTTSAQLEQLQMASNTGAMNGTAAGSDNRALRTELRTLAARVNELAVIIQGPMSHLSETNEVKLAELEQRLQSLEQRKPAEVPRGESVQKAAEKPLVKPANDSTPKKGEWAINLISLRSEKDANAELDRLRKLGVRVEMQRAEKDGKVWYRLRVPGFSSYEGAKAYIDTVENKAGVRNAWVARD